MKRWPWMLICLSIVFSAGTGFAEVPHQIGPFVLNQPISDFKKFVSMETALPVRYMEYIQEVEIVPIKGFKSGLIAFSTCETSHRIVRIKLKYADSSKKFYEALLKKIEKQFGKSDEYRGDPFRIVLAWKWSFLDKDNNRISLILQHNTRDEEEKMGNSIKLTMTSLLDASQSCQENSRSPAGGTPTGEIVEMEIPGLSGWDLFVPR